MYFSQKMRPVRKAFTTKLQQVIQLSTKGLTSSIFICYLYSILLLHVLSTKKSAVAYQLISLQSKTGQVRQQQHNKFPPINSLSRFFCTLPTRPFQQRSSIQSPIFELNESYDDGDRSGSSSNMNILSAFETSSIANSRRTWTQRKAPPSSNSSSSSSGNDNILSQREQQKDDSEITTGFQFGNNREHNNENPNRLGPNLFSQLPSLRLPTPSFPDITKRLNRSGETNTIVKNKGEQGGQQQSSRTIQRPIREQYRIKNTSDGNKDNDADYYDQDKDITPYQQSTGTGSKRRRRREKMQPMPVRGYDAVAIEEYYDFRPLEVGWRLNSLGLPLLAWYHGLLIDKALKRDQDVSIQRQRGIELRELLINSKSVALIKSGQALSLRPDLMRNPYWAEELGKLVDAVGAFPDVDAMKILRNELSDLKPRIENYVKYSEQSEKGSKVKGLAALRNSSKKNRLGSLNEPSNQLQKMVQSDPVLSLFEFYNDNKVVASASIGQVYKARIIPGPKLEAVIGVQEAAKWGNKIVAIKVQRPDAVSSASLDMYLLRRSTTWLSKVRGGSLPEIADAFGMQLFGELDYIREANNCERFRELYGTGSSVSSTNDWDQYVKIPAACTPLTRQRILVLEWIEGNKGPWEGDSALEMVSIGLRCSVDQLMTTGLFHADPHRGNLIKTPDNRLGIIDFGSVVDIDEDFRYSLFGLVIGLQNKDLQLVTENLFRLGFLKDATQLDQVIVRLTKALKNASGGTGKASNVNFAMLQAELDEISRERILKFSTPPFFTIILRSLTILEGVAQSVDKNFRLVRGAYPYVLRQLLSGMEDRDGRQPKALQKLLVRLLTVDGKGEEIKWETLRDFLRLAQKATKRYNPSDKEMEGNARDKGTISRKTLELFTQFLTSGTGIFLKKPLIHELAETIDGMASIGEGMLIKASRGFLPTLPGMNGPVNDRRMEEVSALIETFQDALITQENGANNNSSPTVSGMARIQTMIELVRELSHYVRDSRFREESGPIIDQIQSVIQMVAVEVLEIRGSRAVRSLLRLQTN